MTDTIARPDATIIHTAPADTVNGVNVAETTEQPAQQSTIDAVAVTEPGTRECVEVDPTTLIIGDNVRAAAHLDRQFLASLREFGVMNPIQVTRADDGALTVKRGQRRTLGAVKVGLTTVPVLVVADDTDEADRIVKQWHENERRDALTETDRLAAVEQLTILGVPAGNIARAARHPQEAGRGRRPGQRQRPGQDRRPQARPHPHRRRPDRRVRGRRGHRQGHPARREGRRQRRARRPTRPRREGPP